MKANSKILAIAVVAMFCATTTIAAEMAEDTEAADQKTYHLYVEFVDEKLHVTHGVWISFSCEKTIEGYAAAADKALKDAIKDFKDIGNVSDYGVIKDPKYGGVSFTYDGSKDGIWPSTFYNNDGKWAKVGDTTEDYINADSAVVLYHPAKLDAYVTLVDPTATGPFYFNASELPDGAQVKDFIVTTSEWGTTYDFKPNAGPNDYSKKSNTILYVAIAIVVILVILALAYYFLVAKKKNAAA